MCLSKEGETQGCFDRETQGWFLIFVFASQEGINHTMFKGGGKMCLSKAEEGVPLCCVTCIFFFSPFGAFMITHSVLPSWYGYIPPKKLLCKMCPFPLYELVCVHMYCLNKYVCMYVCVCVCVCVYCLNKYGIRL